MLNNARAEQLNKLIAERNAQIKALEEEVSEMQAELNIFYKIDEVKQLIKKHEEKIKEYKAQFDSTDWHANYEEAYEDKNWHALHIAEKYIRDEKYLQSQINEEEIEIRKLQEYIKSLEEKLKTIYEKVLLEEDSEQAEPAQQ